jgi:membrane-associated phospholipid phosphatase
MNGSLEWGVQVVLWFQTNTAWLEGAARWLSFLGTMECFLLLVPIVYWCVDSNLGIRMGVLLVTATSAGSLLKMAFHLPRPYWYDARVRALMAEPTYGMPSLHAIFAAVLWPWLGERAYRRPGLAVGLFLALAVALSRVQLGVHFPGDVAAGLAVGALLWWIVMRGMDWIGPRLGRMGLGWQIAAAAAASLLLLLLQAAVLASIAGVTDPSAWAVNAARAGAIAPRDPIGLLNLAGLILGLGAGLACQRRWAPFRADGLAGKRAARFLVGIIGLLLVWQGLGMVFPAEPLEVGYLFRYIRSGLTGYWAVFGAPWLFLKLRLTDPEKATDGVAG